MIRALIAIAVGVTAVIGITTSASAAKSSDTVMLTCGSDAPIEVITNGNGTFTPAHDPATHAVYIPVAFSNVHGTFTDSEGTVFEFADPDVSRGGPKNVTLINCHFVSDFSDENGTGHVEGDVTGYAKGGQH